MIYHTAQAIINECAISEIDDLPYQLPYSTVSVCLSLLSSQVVSKSKAWVIRYDYE